MALSVQTVFADPTVEPTKDPSETPAATTVPTAQPIDNKQQTSEQPFPTIHAGAAILIDMKTGRVLYEDNADTTMFPASTTKILTGIMALENLDLNQTVTATDAAIAPITLEHSAMGILRGEELTVEQLIYGMLVYSANDAANVLAVTMGGSIEGFAEMMNKRAAELGATNSHFVNPHGFHDDNHYTTARDLAIISRYAMQNEKFREIVKTSKYFIPPTNKYKQDRNLITTNHLISKYKTTALYYKPAIGIKTGSTSQALSCLVAAAEKDDNEFLSVLMKCPNQGMAEMAYSFSDTKALFEYAFDNYKYISVASKDKIISDSKVYEAKDNARVALCPNEDISMLLPKNIDLEKDIITDIKVNENIEAPIEKGQVLGHVSFTYKNELLGETDLIASNAVERDMVLFTIHLIVNTITNPLFYIPAALLAVAGILARISYLKNKRKSRSRARSRKYNRFK